MSEKVIVSFEVSKDFAHQTKVEAALLNLSRSELFRRAVFEFLQKSNDADSTSLSGSESTSSSTLQAENLKQMESLAHAR